jgi:hypothetical protein
MGADLLWRGRPNIAEIILISRANEAIVRKLGEFNLEHRKNLHRSP